MKIVYYDDNMCTDEKKMFLERYSHLLYELTSQRCCCLHPIPHLHKINSSVAFSLKQVRLYKQLFF
jgi:hypothetical protein